MDSNAGHDQFFVEHFKNWQNDFLAFALSRLKQKHLAEDAVQDLFIKAKKNLNQLQDKTKLKPWLIRTLSHICMDYHRKKKKEVLVSPEDKINFFEKLPDNSKNHSDKIENAEIVESILDAMLEIEPEAYRDVIVLYYYRNLKIEEIADMLEVEIGTVKSRLSRGRSKLKKELEKHGIRKDTLQNLDAIRFWPFL
ncbi:MAG: RNA polymerase sigma factor [Candidatus Hydrogenedentota bacterium]|nr:MAG: RNA polymerase sigma factor [Candidatus Hydrogenedentota bacterium]